MAIQRDFDSLPDFDTEQYNTENWARNYPALKIYSSGRSFTFMYNINTI